MRNAIREWVEGHITVTVRGKRFERLINLALREGLHIWNIKRISGEHGQMDMLIRDYFRLRPLLRETGCRCHVLRRDGLPFWLIRMRLRFGFTIGVVLFIIGLYMLSGVVWNVEIVGNHRIPTEEVSRAAEKFGIKVGAWKFKLKEPLVLQQEIQGVLPDVSRVGVDIEGTRVVIEVVEKEKPEVKPEAGPRNLIAKKKAVIHSVLPEAGKSMVKVNQYVDKGQVLISGLIGSETSQQLVSAKGKVEGEVWYVSNVSVPLAQTVYELTGDKQDAYYLTVGQYALRLWPLRQDPYERYEQSEQRYQFSYDRFTFPIGFKRQIQQKAAGITRTLSEAEAIEAAKRFARNDVLKRAGADATIKDEKVLHVKRENGKVYLSIHYSVIEDITAEQPLVALPPAPLNETDQ
ncbi:sporulation protein YqfD [Brevibacillus massiliensis]|jgi:similar to stage IV sporulation protein|uniref:sporulation protein YqfD n=1 Tax=Brevibacillus massiliensis TaxID=1118054 RepID=UPI00031C69FE|nr:sporulation protein YqfD [Brevibacillus massiliensis]